MLEGEFLFFLSVRHGQRAYVFESGEPKLSKVIGQTNRVSTVMIITVGLFGGHCMGMNTLIWVQLNSPLLWSVWVLPGRMTALATVFVMMILQIPTYCTIIHEQSGIAVFQIPSTL